MVGRSATIAAINQDISTVDIFKGLPLVLSRLRVYEYLGTPSSCQLKDLCQSSRNELGVAGTRIFGAARLTIVILVGGLGLRCHRPHRTLDNQPNKGRGQGGRALPSPQRRRPRIAALFLLRIPFLASEPC